MPDVSMPQQSLQILRSAIEQDRMADVRRYLNDLDDRTGNAFLARAGERYGFITVEVDGVRYALGRDLAFKFYGRNNTGSFARIVERYGENFLSIQGFNLNGKSLLRVEFSLHPSDYSATFATWKHFLIAGLKGETPMAREIQQYLLNAERENRVNQAAEQETGLSTSQLLRIAGDVPERINRYQESADFMQAYLALTTIMIARRICEALGVDWSSQSTKLTQSKLFKGHTCRAVIRTAGGMKEVIGLDLDYLPAWLNSISVERISPESQSKLLRGC